MTAELALSAPYWVRAGSTHAVGEATLPDGELLRAQALAAHFDGIADRNAWLSAIAALNGCFAVVTNRNGDLRAAVDRLRTRPLFYSFGDSVVRLSDSVAQLIPKVPRPTFDNLCRLEFEFCGYVTGEETLVPGLRQIRAGHALMHIPGEDDEPRQTQYYAFRHRSFDTSGDAELTAELGRVHERVFRRLLADVGDRQLVIPLSGGYDSRLIGVSLRELGARKVLCFSYGTEGNWEAAISRELAQYLRFRWVMIPYSHARWRALASTPEFNAYFLGAGQYASVPHLQDWPAVQELVSRGELARDAVFVPGHSGDFLAGSHIPKQFLGRRHVTRGELLQSLFDAHYSLWDWPSGQSAEMRRAFSTRIERVVGPVGDGTPEQAADLFECWDCQERQAKFICNSLRVYEYFGFEWRLPLFDAELMDFWSRIPIEGRVARRLYFEFVRRHQRLPVTAPNTDRGSAVRAALRLTEAAGLRPLATRLRRRLRRIGWRRQYEGGDLEWFGLIDPEVFRAHYTGRENGHAFFARKYLEALGG